MCASCTINARKTVSTGGSGSTCWSDASWPGNAGSTGGTWLTGAAIVPATYAQPDRRGVWVQGGADPQPIDLRIGISDGNRTEVMEGALQDGDRVITEVITDERKPAAGAGGFRRMF